MSRECPFTGKKTIFGNSITRRGKAKRLGGVGKKVTGITRRKFKPNIQKVRALIDGNKLHARFRKVPVCVKKRIVDRLVYRYKKTHASLRTAH